MFAAVSLYEQATCTAGAQAGSPAPVLTPARCARLAQLLAGWANVGNSVVHALLILYTVANEENIADYWVKGTWSGILLGEMCVDQR